MGSKDLEVLMKMQDAKNLPKICYLRTIAQISWDISSQLWHISTIGKKLVAISVLKVPLNPNQPVAISPLHVLSVWSALVRSVCEFGASQQISMGFASRLSSHFVDERMKKRCGSVSDSSHLMSRRSSSHPQVLHREATCSSRCTVKTAVEPDHVFVDRQTVVSRTTR